VSQANWFHLGQNLSVSVTTGWQHNFELLNTKGSSGENRMEIIKCPLFLCFWQYLSVDSSSLYLKGIIWQRIA
jgi:hypothetical protein